MRNKDLKFGYILVIANKLIFNTKISLSSNVCLAYLYFVDIDNYKTH